MAVIRPSADLRNNYNEISKLCHETGEPVFITKNGYNDLVVLSNEKYDEMTEETIERLISEKFEQKFKEFEEFKQYVLEECLKAHKEIEEGKGIPMKTLVAEMEEKYGYKCKY